MLFLLEKVPRTFLPPQLLVGNLFVSPCLLKKALPLSWTLVHLLNYRVSIGAAPVTMPCIGLEQPLLLGLLHAHTTVGVDLLASMYGRYCQLPVSQ